VNGSLDRGTTLRLELFADDLRASLEFYERVLGFGKEAERPGGYTPLANAVYPHVRSEGWPRSAELRRQPWGLTDFRLLDPDGYYWRVTSRD
jgi:uncharacterized glyoxalase superfamily protein PhnB